MGAGDNGWTAMHTAYANGLGNGWAAADGVYSLGYFNREDIPTQFDIAEGWTVMDMATQSVLGATDPNRITWMSGSVNTPGSPTNPDGKGSMILDNNASPGECHHFSAACGFTILNLPRVSLLCRTHCCGVINHLYSCRTNKYRATRTTDAVIFLVLGCDTKGPPGGPDVNCFPFVWKTFPEYLEEAGISWQVWQDLDNFEDNMLAYFEQYQKAANGSALRTKGNSYPGLDAFYKAAADGTLPQVSWIVGPQELAEHAPNQPKDGAWLQKQVVDAITNSPAFKETVLIISYDGKSIEIEIGPHV